jgi:caffeoyl-CoA O-methyltransferase
MLGQVSAGHASSSQDDARKPRTGTDCLLWTRNLAQDAQGLAQSLRHRNLEPATAEFLCGLAGGIRAKRILEIGGSSGLSTIALASPARETSGRVISAESEPQRQAEARQTLARLGLAPYVEFILADAATILPTVGEMDLVFIDSEKDDYVRFFDMLRISPGGLVVADNVISHSMGEYVNHVRARPGLRSLTLPIGKGIELTRFPAPCFQSIWF